MGNTQKRIVLIGPTAPLFKGGIVHYTHCLANALSEHADVTVISFSRPYPKLLYKQKQETEAFTDKKYDELSLIDWANPFSWMHSNSVIKQLNPSLVIFQWWTAFWGIPYLSLLTPGVRRIGIVHNISDHEKIPFSKEIGSTVLNKCDALVTHASTMERKLHEQFPQKITLTQLHPTHTMFTPTTHIKTKNPTLLFFGHVRPYKGLDTLLEAMPYVKKYIPAVRLNIVGEFWGDERKKTDTIIQKLNIAENITIVDHYVSDDEVPYFFSHADALVMPYHTATGTAVSKIALAMQTPIIATSVGDLPDLFNMGTIGKLVVPHNSDALAKAIVSFFGENREQYKKNIQSVAKNLTWDSFALKLLQL